MNIVFAFADDWGRYASAYAKFEGENSPNTILKTPNFDRIASEGAIFKNAFVPAPSCTPCRSSVLSGRYFWQTGLGAILHGAEWDTSIPTFPLELEKNGWNIGYTYKSWAPGENCNAPYGGVRNEYYVGEHEIVPDKVTFGEYAQFSQNVTKWKDEIGLEAAKEKLYSETRNSFKLFLDEQKQGVPFCYWWGPTNTHRGWQAGSGKELWDLNPDDLKGKLPKMLPDTEEIREDFCDYLGEAMAFDAGIGILIEELERIGELDNTLFVISGDHGVPGMPRGKCNLYDLGSEVALAMRFPKTIKAGTEVDRLVNIMDLAPTFLDFANVEIPETFVGNSVMPVVTANEKDDDNNFIVIGRERHADNARAGLPYPQRAIRTKDYLYIINFEPDRLPAGRDFGMEDDLTIDYMELFKSGKKAYPDMDASPTKVFICQNRADEYIYPFFKLAFSKRPYEELYDLGKDKDNIVNVATDEHYSDVKKELSEKLFDVLRKELDPRVVENPCRFETGKYIATSSKRH